MRRSAGPGCSPGCLGGMFGNNSCGTHSLVYGATRDHVIACKGVLSDGSDFDTTRVKDPAYRAARPRLDAILTLLETWRDDPETRRLIEEWRRKMMLSIW